ncbi:hypothetical protein ACTHS9_20790 [Bacillus mycoides]|uniref:hypothetical protein n=1 Tax=Bacillus mycoides TaxID=1405 RepID=UPI000D2F8265
MNIDIKILSAFISVIVSVLTFLIIHLYIEPRKVKRNFKMEQYKNLYAPVYAMILSRLNMAKETGWVGNGSITLGQRSSQDHLDRKAMEKLILSNSGYASIELINIFKDYTASLKVPSEVTLNLVTTIVKEYNQLKKELKMEYNEGELKTGIPEIIKEFREIS